MTVLQKMANFASSLTWDALTPTSIAMAKHCILDTCGVAIMGSQQVDSLKLTEALRQICTNGGSCVWGTPHLLPPPAAALVNAFAAHVHDYDDSCYAGMTHPSAVILPTVFALADHYGASGKDIICAFVAGWEVSGRMGLALPHLLSEGWQCGSLFGALGAAAAGARLLRCDSETSLHAMSLLMCQVGGLRQSNGTKAKPFTLGKAAENAVTACIAAYAGIRGSEHMLEGPEGYFKVFAKNTQRMEVFDTIAAPLIMDSHKVCVKRHPICSSAHAAVEAAATLVARHNFAAADIVSVHCDTTETALRYLLYHEPRNSVEAQFSLPYLLASTLVHKVFDYRKHLCDAAIHDPTINECMRKITWKSCTAVGPDQKSDTQYPESAYLTVVTKNGLCMSHFVGDPLGFPSTPMSDAEYIEKFLACVETLVPRAETACIIKKIAKIEDIPRSLRFSRQVHI